MSTPADRGPGHHAERPVRRLERERGGSQLLLHEQRQQRTQHGEAAPRRRRSRPRPARRAPTAAGGRAMRSTASSAEHAEPIGGDAEQQPALVDAVGERAADEREDEQRSELGHAEQPDREGRSRLVEHLVGERGDRDHAAERTTRPGRSTAAGSRATPAAGVVSTSRRMSAPTLTPDRVRRSRNDHADAHRRLHAHVGREPALGRPSPAAVLRRLRDADTALARRRRAAAAFAAAAVDARGPGAHRRRSSWSPVSTTGCTSSIPTRDRRSCWRPIPTACTGAPTTPTPTARATSSPAR